MTTRRRLQGISALALAAAVLAYAPSADAGDVCPPATVLKGVDLNGTGQNWSEAAAAGIQFAFVKATQAVDFTDPGFADNWSGAKAAGIVRGAYHFFDATVGGVNQANYFLGVMGTLDADDSPPSSTSSAPTARATASATRAAAGRPRLRPSFKG